MSYLDYIKMYESTSEADLRREIAFLENRLVKLRTRKVNAIQNLESKQELDTCYREVELSLLAAKNCLLSKRTPNVVTSKIALEDRLQAAQFIESSENTELIFSQR